MIRVKNKKRQNPILRNIGGIDYEIIDNPEYDEIKLISNISKILNRKFKIIIPKLPVIIFKELDNALGEYDHQSNEIFVESKLYDDFIKNYEYIIFHELGHFLYRHWLSNESLDYFYSYVQKNTKTINFEKLYKLYDMYGEDTLKIKFPLIYVMIHSLKYSQVFNIYQSVFSKKLSSPFNERFLYYVAKEYSSFRYPIKTKRKVFSKPSSSYVLDIGEYNYEDELFCEIFANYMIFDKKLLHDDNYRVLKQILPELRN